MSMNQLSKDQVLTAVAVVLLLFTALINWDIYSWLILIAVIAVLAAWYFKK